MILSDGTIRALLDDRTLVIDPVTDDQIQPASVDFRLAPDFLVFANHTTTAVDPYALPDRLMQDVHVAAGDAFILHPGEFVLGSTVERLELPHDVVARVEGKSSLGRLGLLIHATAGFVDPGFVGRITLELSNVSRLPLQLWPGMNVGQLSFFRLDAASQRPYGHPGLGSKYQGQAGPVASRYDGNRRPATAVAAEKPRHIALPVPNSSSVPSR